jgi:hypothetical protein
MLCLVLSQKFDVSEVLAAPIIRFMRMETVSTSETLVRFYESTQHYIPEDIFATWVERL